MRRSCRNGIEPAELARLAGALAGEYSSPGHAALLVVERNNHGHAVLGHLDQSAQYAPVYEQGHSPGWLTSSASKPEIVAHMNSLLVERRGSSAASACWKSAAPSSTFPAAAPARRPARTTTSCMAMAIAQAVRRELLNSGKHSLAA